MVCHHNNHSRSTKIDYDVSRTIVHHLHHSHVIGPPSNLSLLWDYLSIIVLAGIGFAISNFLQIFVHGLMSQYIVRDIRTEYYRSLQGKSFSFYDSVAVGDLTSRATVDLQFVDMFLRTWLGTILTLSSQQLSLLR